MTKERESPTPSGTLDPEDQARRVKVKSERRSKRKRRSLNELNTDFHLAVKDAGEDLKFFSGYSALKQRVFRFVYHPFTEVAIFVLIIISVGLLIYEVSVNLEGASQQLFFDVEMGLTCFFIVEYVVKFWLAPNKIRFVIRNWIDLLALLPFLRVFRLGRGLRLLRIFRLLRLIRVGSMLQARLASMKKGIEQRLLDNVIVIGFMLFAIVFGTVGILNFERGHNEGFNDIGDALWWCIVTITTVGYGDLYPETTGGRVIAGVIMFIGLAFYAVLTSLVTSQLIERFRREEGKGMDIAGLKNHTVICGWDDHGETIIHELLNNDVYGHIVVITELERISIAEANVHVIQGDFTQRDMLEQARVAFAKAAIVLADQTGGRSKQDADARTILGVLAIESFNSDVHTTAEVINSENQFHLENAGVDELIVTGAYTGNLLAHATINSGLGTVYNDLLTMEGNRLHMVPAPSAMEGMAFMDVLAKISKNFGALLIGIHREGETLLNPIQDVLEPSDVLILISDARPKLR